MLQFLVTSKVRRLLLVLLWGEQQAGSVGELAGLADVSFASAHAELKEMQRLQLVRVDRRGGKEVLSANADHPESELLAKLARTDAQLRPLADPRDDKLKQMLVSLGAPLRGVKPAPVAAAQTLTVLVDAARLARRDPVVARSLPICVWNHRAQLDAKALQALRVAPEDKHALAFFLELAGELGGDRRLVGLAEVLRDARLRQTRPFFATNPVSGTSNFNLAKKWGFMMNMDLEAFRSLFAKFVPS
jgi:molybdenum-dependent DNA-binding transcriptional regulator ModE